MGSWGSSFNPFLATFSVHSAQRFGEELLASLIENGGDRAMAQIRVRRRQLKEKQSTSEQRAAFMLPNAFYVKLQQCFLDVFENNLFVHIYFLLLAYLAPTRI